MGLSTSNTRLETLLLHGTSSSPSPPPSLFCRLSSPPFRWLIALLQTTLGAIHSHAAAPRIRIQSGPNALAKDRRRQRQLQQHLLKLETAPCPLPSEKDQLGRCPSSCPSRFNESVASRHRRVDRRRRRPLSRRGAGAGGSRIIRSQLAPFRSTGNREGRGRCALPRKPTPTMSSPFPLPIQNVFVR